MVSIKIQINGKEVSGDDVESNIFDDVLKARIEQLKNAVGDLPVELVFEGDLHALQLVVRKCPDELLPELHRRLAPFVQGDART